MDTLLEDKLTLVSMKNFLEDWDKNYLKKISKIELFNDALTSAWNLEQKQFFIKLLYHQRAHFDDVLWYMGNFAPSFEAKQIILNNARDEFGMHGLSHERLYLEFANSFNVDLTYELIDEKYYFPFLREYNHGHLRWLREHDWNQRLVAFSAIERLDNLDYLALRDVAVSIGAIGKALTFFNVHIHVQHYDETETLFHEVWCSNSDMIKNVFEFIGDYQLDIWRKISDAVFEKINSSEIKSVF